PARTPPGSCRQDSTVDAGENAPASPRSASRVGNHSAAATVELRMPDGARSAKASVAPRWKVTPKTPPRPKIPTSKRLTGTGPVTHTPRPSVFARLLA